MSHSRVIRVHWEPRQCMMGWRAKIIHAYRGVCVALATRGPMGHQMRLNHCFFLTTHARRANTVLTNTATHCNTLQHTATHCNTLQCTATHCNSLQHTAAHCNALQHTATHCNTLQHIDTHCDTPATQCDTLQQVPIRMQQALPNVARAHREHTRYNLRLSTTVRASAMSGTAERLIIASCAPLVSLLLPTRTFAATH